MKPHDPTQGKPHTPFLLTLLLLSPPAIAQGLRPTLPLSQGAAADEPVVATAGQRVHVAYDLRVGPFDRDLWVTRSLDGGLSFEPPARLDQGPAGADARQPIVLAQGDTVVVAWLDDRHAPGLDAVYARVSVDQGASFGPELRLSPPATGSLGDADELVGAIDLPFVHVGFEDNSEVLAVDPLGTNEDLLVATSVDGGLSFAPAAIVNRPPAGPGSADVDDIALASAQGTAIAVWVDRRSGLADRVFANRWIAGQWQASDVPVDSAPDPSADTGDPVLAFDGQRAAVAWRDRRQTSAPNYDLFGAISLDGGATWTGELRLDGIDPAVPSTVRAPAIALDGDRVHLLWTDNRAAVPLEVHDVWYRPIEFQGSGWTPLAPTRLDDATPAGSANNQFPRILASSGYVLAYYQDTRNDPLGLSDALFLRISTDGGNTFAPELALGQGLGVLGDAEENEVAWTSQREIVAVWADNTLGGLSTGDDIRAQGLRLPYLERSGPAQPFAFQLGGVGGIEIGGQVLVAVSLSGANPLSLPPQVGGFLVALSIDSFTSVGLQLSPLLSAPIDSTGAITPSLFPLPIPFWAVGLVSNPQLGPGFWSATDPIFVPAGT